MSVLSWNISLHNMEFFAIRPELRMASFQTSACYAFPFWYLFISSNLQWEKIATTLYLVHISILYFTYCTLITPTPLLYGLGQITKLRTMDLKYFRTWRHNNQWHRGLWNGWGCRLRPQDQIMSWHLRTGCQRTVHGGNIMVNFWYRL